MIVECRYVIFLSSDNIHVIPKAAINIMFSLAKDMRLSMNRGNNDNNTIIGKA